MCRHLAWLGRPRTLADLMLEQPHGLLQQSWAPRRQAHGTVNADGWGVGFHAEDGTSARWRSPRPLWGEASFASVAPHLRAACVVAAVRSASVGMPIEEGACAPFDVDGWLISHNGRVDRDVLDRTGHPESVCDSAWLAVQVGSGLGHGPDAATRLGVQVRAVAAADPAARLNVLVADGSRVLATTWGDTLCFRSGADGVVAASEPYDEDPGWVDVPDRHLLEITADGPTVTALEDLS